MQHEHGDQQGVPVQMSVLARLVLLVAAIEQRHVDGAVRGVYFVRRVNGPSLGGAGVSVYLVMNRTSRASACVCMCCVTLYFNISIH